MKISRLLSLLAILAFSVSPARADYIVTLLQVGPNAVATGSGAINLTGLSVGDPGVTIDAQIRANLGFIATGPNGVNVNFFGGATGPTSFGSGFNYIAANSGSGDQIAIFGSGFIGLPEGYMSNSLLSSSATWSGATFASLGVTPGTYVWSWGTGANQSFTLQIGEGATVPELGSSIALLFLSLGALFGGRCLCARPRSVQTAASHRAFRRVL